MDGSATLNAIELLVGLLALAGLVAIVARPLRLPYTVALVIAGLAVGAMAAALGQAAIQVTPELVLIALLPGLVFEAAYRLRLDELRRWLSGLVLLAVPGVLISAAVVAVVLSAMTGLRPDLAFLVGAMVSATDPAAVVATFKPLRVSPSLATIVDGESLLNDGTGLVLFAIAVQAVARPTGPLEASRRFIGTVGLSVAIGLVTGWLATRLISLLDDHLIELTISVVLAYGSYLLADQFGLSGVISTVVAAIILGNLGPGRSMTESGADAIDTVWEFLAFLLTAVVFLLIGLAIPPAGLLASIGPIAWAIVGDPRGTGRGRVPPPGWRLAAGAAARSGRPDAGRLAARPVLGRPARCGRGRHGTGPSGRHAPAGTAPGDHLRRGVVHPAGAGDDRRPGRGLELPSIPAATDLIPKSAGDRSPSASAEQPSPVAGLVRGGAAPAGAPQNAVDLLAVLPPDRRPVEPFDVLEVLPPDLAQRPAGVAAEVEDAPRGPSRRRAGGAEPVRLVHRGVVPAAVRRPAGRPVA